MEQELVLSKEHRPTWDELFIKIAMQVAERSTCVRLKVGAILVQDNRIISIGYNGSVPGKLHCNDQHWNEISFMDDHYKWSSINEIHAEQNAILYAARKGITTEGSTLYITHSPCLYCAKSIIAAGIKEVKYKDVYDRESTFSILKDANVECNQVHI